MPVLVWSSTVYDPTTGQGVGDVPVEVYTVNADGSIGSVCGPAVKTDTSTAKKGFYSISVNTTTYPSPSGEYAIKLVFGSRTRWIRPEVRAQARELFGPVVSGEVTAPIPDATVVTAKIKDANVTLAKLATGSVDASKIVDGAVSDTELGNRSSDQATGVAYPSANPAAATLTQHLSWLVKRLKDVLGTTNWWDAAPTTLTAAAAHAADASDPHGATLTQTNLTVTGALTLPAGSVETADLASGAVTAAKVAADVATQSELDAGLALKFNTTGGTITNNVSVTGNVAVAHPTVSSALEMGRTASVDAPFVDFHSSGTGSDYDARIAGSGGSATPGQGTVTVTAAQMTISGVAQTATRLETRRDSGGDALRLEVAGASAPEHGIAIWRRSRGTLVAPALVSNGDYIGSLTWAGWDGTQWAGAAMMLAGVDGVAGAGSMPGGVGFYTTPGGAAAPAGVPRLWIGSNGQLTVGQGSAAAPTLVFVTSGGVEDPDTGIFQRVADEVNVATGGVEVARLTTNQMLLKYWGSGPEYSWMLDPDTGLKYASSDQFRAVAGGTDVAVFWKGGDGFAYFSMSGRWREEGAGSGVATPGTVDRKIPLYNSGGAVVGYVPIFASL
ncbi:MAG: hypothetical protein IT340_19980 [Chloroflexi bacterium]|nr:hypothetical protein [Chloroflexota bacterium]